MLGPPSSCHIFRIWNSVWYRVGGTSQLRNRWMDGFLDGWMDGWREEWEDGWMTMKVSYSQELLSGYLSYPGWMSMICGRTECWSGTHTLPQQLSQSGDHQWRRWEWMQRARSCTWGPLGVSRPKRTLGESGVLRARTPLEFLSDTNGSVHDLTLSEVGSDPVGKNTQCPCGLLRLSS